MVQNQKGFFISHNMDSETADYEVFNKILLQSLNLRKAKEQPLAGMPADISKWKGNYIAVRDKIKSFAYLDFLSGFVTVLPQREQVIFRQFQKDDKVLSPTGKHLFKSADKMMSSHAFYSDPAGNQLISTGFKTFKKINSLYLWAMWLSFILGILALLYLFFGGLIKLITQRMAFLKQISAIPFLSILLLSIPVALFMNQDFTALGDVTPASLSLAILTSILPVAMLAGIWANLSHKRTSKTSGIELLALMLALQFFVVLICWGMIPFQIWV